MPVERAAADVDQLLVVLGPFQHLICLLIRLTIAEKDDFSVLMAMVTMEAL